MRKLEVRLARRAPQRGDRVGSAIVFVLAAGLSMDIWAQTSPPERATQIQDQEFVRQRERERALRHRLEPSPDSRLDIPATDQAMRLPRNERPCFPIHRIRLEGEGSDRFQWALRAANPKRDPALGHCLGARGINVVMTRIQNALVAQGYVTTRVLAGPQDLTTGILRLTVITGTIQRIRFADGTSAKATAWNALPLQAGDRLNLRAIEQGLENFKRLPSVEADLQLVPSTGAQARPGQSDVVIHWSQPHPVRWNLSLDDSGSKASGRLQASLTASLDDALHLNDLFYINLNHDAGWNRYHGTHGLTAHYSVPLKYWLFGVTTTRYTFAQLYDPDKEVQRVRYIGKSNTAELRISRILHRSARAKTAGYGRIWQRASRNYFGDLEVAIQHRRLAGWEAGLTHHHFIAAATVDVSGGFRRGTGAFGALHTVEELLGQGTSRLRLLVADAQLLLPFHLGQQAIQLTSQWRGQWNLTHLITQDQFALGGRYSVRGFDGETTLLGQRGWLLRNEIAFEMPAQQSVYWGLDTGLVSHMGTAQHPPGHRLVGTAVGIRGGWQSLYWDVFIGAPIHEPRAFQNARVVSGFSLNATF